MLESAEINRCLHAEDIAKLNMKRRRHRVVGELQRVDLRTGTGKPDDEVLVLRPKGSKHFPGKQIFVAEDGSIAVDGATRASFFAGLALIVDGIDSLHAAFTRVCEAVDGPGFTVRGALADGADPRSMTRCKHLKLTMRDGGKIVQYGRPRGVVDVARRWAVLDLDKLPNLWQMDPRQNPEAVARRIINDLMPLALRGVRMSWQMSSTMCIRLSKEVPEPLVHGRPPSTLSMHLRVWLDRPLAEADIGGLLSRLRRYVEDRLVAMGQEPGAAAAVVDAATAVYNQAVYSIRPEFAIGLADPFPDQTRYGLFHDGRDQLIVDDLAGELPMLAATPRKELSPEQRLQVTEAMRRGREANRAERDRIKAMTDNAPTAPDAPMPVVDTSGPVHRMLARREALLTEADEKAERKRRGFEANKSVFRLRALRDIERLVAWRRQRDPVWRAAGGVPEGLRSRTMYAVASLLSFTLARDDIGNIGAYLIDAGKLRAAIREYAGRLVDMGWFEREWVALRYDASAVGGAIAAKQGFKGRGRRVAETAHLDPRSDPSKNKLINLLDITPGEMLHLELEALTTPSIAKEIRRRKAGMQTLAARREREQTASEATTKPWKGAGVSRATWHRAKAALTEAVTKETKRRRPKFLGNEPPLPEPAVVVAALMHQAVEQGVALKVRLLVSEYHREEHARRGSVGTRPTVTDDVEPWKLEGISKRTWYRRRATEPEADFDNQIPW
jgi:hypothetical protein